MERLIDWNGKVNTYIANERPLDPRLGRWLRLDPELQQSTESSPYTAMDNDPLNKVDEEGDIWNFIAGAAIGAAMDYGMQVAGNLAQGKSVGDALTQVDKTSILISAASGALTSGASALGGKVVKVVAKEAIDVGEKVVRKAVDNARQGKSLISTEDLKGVAVDYAKDKVSGVVMGAAMKKAHVSNKPSITPPTKPTVKPSTSPGKPPIDPNWKSKIEGKAQKTGTPGHQVRAYREAIAAAKDPNVEKVYLDKGINKAAGLPPGTIKPNRRPDVTIVNKSGTIDQIEVPSKTDKPVQLWLRMADTRDRLDPSKRGEIRVSPIK